MVPFFSVTGEVSGAALHIADSVIPSLHLDRKEDDLSSPPLFLI